MFTNVYSRSQSKKKAFTKSCTKWADDLGKKEIEKDLAQVILTVRLNDNRMTNMDPISDSYAEFSSCSHTDCNFEMI